MGRSGARARDRAEEAVDAAARHGLPHLGSAICTYCMCCGTGYSRGGSVMQSARSEHRRRIKESAADAALARAKRRDISAPRRQARTRDGTRYLFVILFIEFVLKNCIENATTKKVERN